MKNLMRSTLALLLFAVNPAEAQNVNDIVKSHITAIGGSENWNKLKSMNREMVIKAQGAEIKLHMHQIQNKALRVDVEVMGMSGFQLMTDKEGWSFMPFAGQTKPEPVTPDDVKSSQDQLDLIDEFITYQAKGKKIDYLGKDEVEGTECHKVSLTEKDGTMTTYYLDASTYYIIKEVTKRKVNGKEIEGSTTYSNYKKLPEGIVMAMSQSGDQGDMETTSVEINKNVDESLFQPKTLDELKK